MPTLTKTLPTVFDIGPGDTRPMSEEETRIFVGLMLSVQNTGLQLAKGKDLEAALREYAGKEETAPLPFLLAVLAKRLAVNAPEMVFDLDMIAWASVLTDRVGVSVLWAYSLYRATIKNNMQPVTLSVWAKQLHPEGPPTQDFYFKCWDAQKGERGELVDNWLDHSEAWA